LSAGKGARLIVEDIIREADEKASGIVKAADKEAKTLLNAARFEARQNEELESEKARARGGQVRDEILAEGRLKAKKELLQRREEIINEVFKEADRKIREYTSSKRYETDLIRIAIETCKKLGSENLVIYANKRDLRLLEKSRDQIARESGDREKPINISFGEPIQASGGVKVGAPDRRIEIDETFDGRVKRQFEVLRVKVAKALFEGSGSE
jgi:vacuolar-type H+-ATPase subunit E/Vma4